MSIILLKPSYISHCNANSIESFLVASWTISNVIFGITYLSWFISDILILSSTSATIFPPEIVLLGPPGVFSQCLRHSSFCLGHGLHWTDTSVFSSLVLRDIHSPCLSGSYLPIVWQQVHTKCHVLTPIDILMVGIVRIVILMENPPHLANAKTNIFLILPLAHDL